MLCKLLALWIALFSGRVSTVQTYGKWQMWIILSLWFTLNYLGFFLGRFSIMPKTKKCLDDIDKFIKEKHFDECGIIYCLSRMDCEKVAERLQVFLFFVFSFILHQSFKNLNNHACMLHVIWKSTALKILFWDNINVYLYILEVLIA
jgi:hypothetical protein